MPSTTLSKIRALIPELLAVAQSEYDTWQQDANGINPELGCGGICQDIAEAMAGVVAQNGIDVEIVDNDGVGEQHVWGEAPDADHRIIIDIPAAHYERGGGYVWRKKPNVRFRAEHLIIEPIRI